MFICFIQFSPDDTDLLSEISALQWHFLKNELFNQKIIPFSGFSSDCFQKAYGLKTIWNFIIKKEKKKVVY